MTPFVINYGTSRFFSQHIAFFIEHIMLIVTRSVKANFKSRFMQNCKLERELSLFEHSINGMNIIKIRDYNGS